MECFKNWQISCYTITKAIIELPTYKKINKQEIKYCSNDTIYTVLLVLHHSYRAISFEAESANIQDDPVLAVHVLFFVFRKKNPSAVAAAGISGSPRDIKHRRDNCYMPFKKHKNATAIYIYIIIIGLQQ